MPPSAGAEQEQANSDKGPSYPLPTVHLRNAAIRLAAELDEAGLFHAAAYASMAVDAIPSGIEPDS
jgi:hypothetical protein